MVVGIVRALTAVGVVGVLSFSGASAAHADTANWGQEVKACNMTSCYAGGVSRGGYVSVQARDTQGPGYGYEIHTLAFPGNSAPTLP